jgi:hypothetical protein
MTSFLAEIATYETDIVQHMHNITADGHPDETTLTIQCLEFLQIRLIEHINQGRYTCATLRRFIHPTFEWRTPHLGSSPSNDEFLAALERAWLMDSKEYRMEIDHVCAAVSGSATGGRGRPTRATVWSTLRGPCGERESLGLWTGVVRDSIGKSRWEMVQGVGWFLMSFSSMKGFEAVS